MRRRISKRLAIFLIFQNVLRFEAFNQFFQFRIGDTFPFRFIINRQQIHNRFLLFDVNDADDDFFEIGNYSRAAAFAFAFALIFKRILKTLFPSEVPRFWIRQQLGL